MRNLYVFFLILITLCGSAQTPPQQSDAQLAYEYYNHKEYGKAAELFLKLYERSRYSQYLDYYVISLINNKEYDKAEESLKKYLKTDDNNKDFLVSLGYIYMQQGKVNKAEETFKKAINKLVPNNNDITNLAYKFANIREYDWANKVYLKGRDLLKNPNLYTLEIGDNYMYDRNYTAMLGQFTTYLLQNPGNINLICSKLNTAKMYDVNESMDTLLITYLAKILTQPNYNPIFDHLKTWHSLQVGNFPQALEYAQKLNDKMPEKLDVFLNIAREARRAKYYGISTTACKKIIEAGKEKNPYYTTATKEIIFSKYEEYKEKTAPLTEYAALAKDAERFIKTNTFNDEHTDIVILLADLYMYQLHVPDSANILLENAVKTARLSTNSMNLLKLKRADILAFADNPWEATIIYTQIEKAAPNSDIGYEAKLKKAWMAYYEGDLVWANAQFSVLKGSTSKLIANDALKISHFITMNYDDGDEADNSVLEKVGKAEYLIFKKQSDKALLALDSILLGTEAGIADYVSLLKAKLFLEQKETNKAITQLQSLKDKSGEVSVQAEAIFLLAELEAKQNKKAEALTLYKQLITDYSGSVYSVDAAQNYRNLEKLNSEN